MHGDFCFTNIFYDFRTRRIVAIDPRGTVNGVQKTIYGDLRYDIAKFAHSIVGGYDMILCDRFKCSGFESYNLKIDFYDTNKMMLLQEISSKHKLLNISLLDKEIAALMIHLFISMIPLHKDNKKRQIAFLANALRLFKLNFN